MSKPVNCLVVEPATCPKPYKVDFDKHGFYVVEFDKEHVYAGDISPMVFEEELNEAYKRGVDDATKIIVDKMLDGMLDNLGVC